MSSEIILGKSIDQWLKEYPLLQDIISLQEVFWSNPQYNNFDNSFESLSINKSQIEDADKRLLRFAPYISKVFPETQISKGIIESSLLKIPQMQNYLHEYFDTNILGSLYLKCDSHLPISGSIKARGGVYEVLKHAEKLALDEGLLNIDDDYSIIDTPEFKKFFSNYSISVGSTGNLGLSIGIISAQLGFKVYVHMSSDAKQWKKDLLKSENVNVIEYDSDYSVAVAEGRKESAKDPNNYFIDDENSKNLFLGYSVASIRLAKQLNELEIQVDDEHPLFVYLPCGVGGGPGGVAYGLKTIFKDNVHCFFGEPTHSPSMLIGLLTQLHDKICVQDFNIDNITEADGLAVGRPSGFVGKTLNNLLSGTYTVTDENLYVLLSALAITENIYLEPSALAGVVGVIDLLNSDAGIKYIKNHNLVDKMQNATHIAWATGGSMVPKEEMNRYFNKGINLKEKK